MPKTWWQDLYNMYTNPGTSRREEVPPPPRGGGLDQDLLPEGNLKWLNKHPGKEPPNKDSKEWRLWDLRMNFWKAQEERLSRPGGLLELVPPPPPEVAPPSTPYFRMVGEEDRKVAPPNEPVPPSTPFWLREDREYEREQRRRKEEDRKVAPPVVPPADTQIEAAMRRTSEAGSGLFGVHVPNREARSAEDLHREYEDYLRRRRWGRGEGPWGGGKKKEAPREPPRPGKEPEKHILSKSGEGYLINPKWIEWGRLVKEHDSWNEIWGPLREPPPLPNRWLKRAANKKGF